MSVERQLKRILALPLGEREVPLNKLAQKLGCSLSSKYDAAADKYLEPEMVRRVREAARARREERLWLVALLSALASVFAAAAAWVAVASR